MVGGAWGHEEAPASFSCFKQSLRGWRLSHALRSDQRQLQLPAVAYTFMGASPSLPIVPLPNFWLMYFRRSSSTRLCGRSEALQHMENVGKACDLVSGQAPALCMAAITEPAKAFKQMPDSVCTSMKGMVV
jgi:hypothetical protein